MRPCVAIALFGVLGGCGVDRSSPADSGSEAATTTPHDAAPDQLAPAGDGGLAPGTPASPESDANAFAIPDVLGPCEPGAAADDAAADAGAETDSGCVPLPLGDAGFSSLADLPLEELCASGNDVYLESTVCSCTLLVLTQFTNPSGSGSGGGVEYAGFYLFDATTGALEGVGGAHLGYGGVGQCGGVAPGFQWPAQCFAPWSWGNRRSLCPGR